jgi:site-specific recombinase XerD
LVEVAEGVIVRPMLTLDDAIDRYLGDLTRRGKAERTRDTYRRTLDDFCDTLPHHWDVAKIGDDDVRRFLDRYNRRSPAYRAQKDSTLRGLFTWLYTEGKIRQHPMGRMLPPRRQRPEDVDVVTVSSEEVRAMLTCCETWTERLTLAVLAYMGPRRRACARLRVFDYDPAARRLRFHEKGDKTIWKPVPHQLAELIEAALAADVYAGEDDYLIPNVSSPRRTGDRDDRIIWRTVRAVAERAGVRAHTHSLRAAFAVYYLETNPGEVESLKELLGHRSILTTQLYLRRLDRGVAMERVRSLDWSEIAAKPFDALREAEKEGFEPSMEAFTPITP